MLFRDSKNESIDLSMQITTVELDNSPSKVLVTNSMTDLNQQQNKNNFYKNKESSKSGKKPWYSAFTFSYKQRNEDFKRLFKDLPADERLLVGRFQN